MLLDDTNRHLERMLRHYPENSIEYKRIQLLMFGYSDDEIDGKYCFNYDNDEFAERVTSVDYLWDYTNICAGSIMRDDYFEHHFNNKDNMSVI